jgi:magnesium transporter
LLREDSEFLTERTLPFLRDCLDHIKRLVDTADTYRETCGELRELYFALLGQKTNDVMKVLTVIATIFIPMSFIAGIYGMNFDSEASSLNMPCALAEVF